MRRFSAAILLTVLAAALLALWHPVRVALQALLLLPAMFPAAPLDPLGQITPQPARTHHEIPYAAGTIEADVFHPGTPGPHGGLVLLLGIGDLPRSDLGVRFAEALARSGVVVMLPLSPGLLAERLTFDEVDGLVASYDLLTGLPDVDAERAGFVGLSASGALSIVAAAQPALRDRVRFVNSFGSYADARSLIVDVASHTTEVDGQVVEWQPESRTESVVAIALADLLPDPDDPARQELLSGTTRERAHQLVADLPAEARERLASISPSSYLGQLRAHLYLMHDTADTFVPFTESRALVGAAPPGIVQRYTEFSIFEHVVPEKAVPWQTFVPDVVELYRHVHAVLLELL